MLNVTCAIIRNEEYKILVVQRGKDTDHPLQWEFPGGKLKRGESEEDCIIREIDEELSIGIVICGRLNPVEYDYGFKQIRLIPFICDTLDELPFLSEHAAFRWVNGSELKTVDLCEADRIVAGEYILVSEKTEVECREEEKVPDETGLSAELETMISSIMSMQEAEWLATSAIDNPGIFRKLFELSFSDDPRLAFRASWTLTKAGDRFPEFMDRHLTAFVEGLHKINNESTQRSFLRIISRGDISVLDKRLHGLLADQCFTWLRSGVASIAVKAYSMDILYRLTLIYPELMPELTSSIRMVLEDASAGIASKGRNILKRLSDSGVSGNEMNS